MSAPPAIPLTLDGNDACVADLGLWLDPHRAREFAFVSHAHADHFAPHGSILCSTPTRRLIEARYGAAAQRAGVTLPMGTLARDLLRATCEGGWQEEDDAAIYKYYRRRFGLGPA